MIYARNVNKLHKKWDGGQARYWRFLGIANRRPAYTPDSWNCQVENALTVKSINIRPIEIFNNKKMLLEITAKGKHGGRECCHKQREENKETESWKDGFSHELPSIGGK